jgi:uncharacterized protein
VDRQRVLECLKQHRPEINDRFAIKDLAIFGSVARDEARDDSDIDILVAFEGRADFDRFMELRFYLEDLLGSRVDLVTQKAVRPPIRPYIEKDLIHVA